MDSLGQKYLDSREVAEMVGKEHNKLLRDIRVYITQLNASKVGHTDFFTESQYTDKSNRQKPCYLVTKKGCEFIAHKLTGVKGTEFTAKYINRFHEMEDTIKTQLPQGNDLIALAVIEAQKMIAERDKQIERMKPKEIFADAVSASKDAILIGDLAKLISQNGYRIGQNRLFDWLRNNGYLIKSGSSRNRPMQRYVESIDFSFHFINFSAYSTYSVWFWTCLYSLTARRSSNALRHLTHFCNFR
mgnify:CR=1 FL=1